MTKRDTRLNIRNKLRLLWMNGKRCGICGKKIQHFDEMTIDHIIPLSRGGSNEIDNCQLAHALCNSIKGDLIEKEDKIVNRPYYEKRIIVGKCFVGFGVYLVGLAMFCYAISKWI